MSAREGVAPRVTLLAAGDTVYVYAADDPNIDGMCAVLDIAYPGEEVLRRTLTVDDWPAVRAAIREHTYLTIVDVRADRAAAVAAEAERAAG